MDNVHELNFGGKYGVIRRIKKPNIHKNMKAAIIKHIQNIICRYQDITFVEFFDHGIHIWGIDNNIVENFQHDISKKLHYMS
jgi:hypothetical protein